MWTSVPIDSLRDEDGDIILHVAKTHITAHGSTELKAWQALYNLIGLVIENIQANNEGSVASSTGSVASSLCLCSM